MICCGSGEVLVPIPATVPIQVPDPDNIKTSFPKTKKIAQKLAFYVRRRLLYFSESRPLISDSFDFLNTFYVGSGSKLSSGTRSETETVMHSGSSSAKTKRYGSCGSGSGSTDFCF